MQLRHDSPLPSRFSIKGILWDINRPYIQYYSSGFKLSTDCLPVSRGLIVTEKLRAAFHKYRPSGGTSQKIDFLHILLIGSP